MEEQFKERISAALLGDILVELAKRKSVKDLLSEFDGYAADELVHGFVDAFENILRQKAKEQKSAPVHHEPPPVVRQTAAPPPPPLKIPPLPPATRPTAPSLDIKEPPVAFTSTIARSIPVSAPPPPPPLPPPPPPAVVAMPAPAMKPAAKIPFGPPADDGETIDRFRKSLDLLLHDQHVEEEKPVPPEPVPVKRSFKKIPYDVNDDDFVYIHGIGEIPGGEEPSDQPFMLEEKGIEDREFAFACDFSGLRIFGTKMLGTTSNVSKTGVLLLGKQESIRLKGAHENVLNELRAHGPLLPVQFGTVARGMDELERLIGTNRVGLLDALDELMGTEWWTLSVYALDSLIAEAATTDDDARARDPHVRRRTSEGRVLVRSIDIKSLERVLAKQKRIAESVHEQLDELADRSDIVSQVSLGSGSSDEWKLILKASYLIPPERTAAFHHAVIDLQYQHFLHEIMFALAGDREAYAFKRR